jgi:hypothetical protein
MRRNIMENMEVKRYMNRNQLNITGEIKALGDALATMGDNSESVKNLGYLVIEKAEEVICLLDEANELDEAESVTPPQVQ